MNVLLAELLPHSAKRRTLWKCDPPYKGHKYVVVREESDWTAVGEADGDYGADSYMIHHLDTYDTPLTAEEIMAPEAKATKNQYLIVYYDTETFGINTLICEAESPEKAISENLYDHTQGETVTVYKITERHEFKISCIPVRVENTPEAV